MFASLSLGLALMPFVSAVVHDIQVGANGKLEFSPEAIAAQPGDQVVFHFVSKNHTATQSSFADPCGHLEGGFDSDFHPVPANQTDNFPTYTINVVDTKPVWFYCRQKTPVSHCGMGMVFAVNCGLDGQPNSFTNFKNSALAVGAAQASATPSAAAGGYGGYGSGGYGSPAPTPAANDGAAVWTTAAYGDYTIPVAPQVTPVTQTITLGDQVWTTTYNSYPGSPDPTPAAAEGNVIKVVVGGPGQNIFTPNNIQAKPRDIIRFEFHQKNHSVTQSSFADPCRRQAVNGVSGFDSGFMPVADGATEFPTWDLVVNDTSPTWAYCRQTAPVSHCGGGMVLAINAVESSERNFSAFQNVAKALNGTAAAAEAAPTTGSNGSNTSGAVPVRVGSAAVTVVAAAAIALFL